MNIKNNKLLVLVLELVITQSTQTLEITYLS